MPLKTSDSFYLIAQRRKGYQLIADHYIINRKRSNFIYIAIETCSGYGVKRKHVHHVLDRFPDMKGEISARTYRHYNQHTFKPINDFRKRHLSDRNMKIGNPKDVQVELQKHFRYPDVEHIQCKVRNHSLTLKEVEKEAENMVDDAHNDHQDDKELLDLEVGKLQDFFIKDLDNIETFITKARWKLTNLTYQVQASNVL